MANKTAVLYQRIRFNSKWTFKKITDTRRRNLAEGVYYLSWYEGSEKRMEPVGADASVETKALDEKNAELSFLGSGGELKTPTAETGRARATVRAAISTLPTAATDKGSRATA